MLRGSRAGRAPHGGGLRAATALMMEQEEEERERDLELRGARAGRARLGSHLPGGLLVQRNSR